MRPATSQSADGPLNLYNAVAVAADPASQGRGVLVVANDEVHTGRDVHKTHTTAVQTFVSTTRGTIGKVYYGKVRYGYMPTYRHTTTSEFATATALDRLPRVDIVYAHEGVDGTIVKAAVAAGAKGIVLAGVGDGNATTDMINALAEAAKTGVVVVRASHVGCGIVRRNVELDDDKLGFVAGDGPEPAEGARPPARRADADERRQEDPEVLRRVLTLNGGLGMNSRARRSAAPRSF